MFLYDGSYKDLKRKGILDYMVSLHAACIHLQPVTVLVSISLVL